MSTRSRFEWMHAANSYLHRIGKATKHAVLSAQEASVLEAALQSDAGDFFQAAVVSFVDALRSIEAGFFSWATVKLYYVLFYALRARLAADGDCIFHVVKSPKLLCALPGNTTKSLSGNTHKAVLGRFKETHKRDYFLSQEIAGQPPLDWFTMLREQTNYREGRFSEPSVPPHLMYAARVGRREMLAAYLAEDIYVFDEDHAIVAFPFKLLIEARKSIFKASMPLRLAEIEFLRGRMRDRAGYVVSLDGMIS